MKTDYNSRIIKIILFLFSFSLYYTVNALFFSEKTFHKIYEIKGDFDFIYQLPTIFYSSIVTISMNAVIKYLSLSEDNIVKLKNEKTNRIVEKGNALINFLAVKFMIFFLLVFLFSLFFWYYLSCFCVIYKNTQIHLIKDSLISFGISLLYPFPLNLLPGLFRIPSLNAKNKKCIYQMSKIIQLI